MMPNVQNYVKFLANEPKTQLIKQSTTRMCGRSFFITYVSNRKIEYMAADKLVNLVQIKYVTLT